MKLKYKFYWVCLFLLASCNTKTNVDLLITGGTIIDVTSGNLITGKVIAIVGDSIVSVFESGKLSRYSSKANHDANGKFIIPGLWDNHVHFGGGDSLIQENKNLLPLYVANGITAVRDAAADISPSVLQWREEIAQGKLFRAYPLHFRT